jgi:hypothetical protein
LRGFFRIWLGERSDSNPVFEPSGEAASSLERSDSPKGKPAQRAQQSRPVIRIYHRHRGQHPALRGFFRIWLGECADLGPFSEKADTV